MASDPTHLPIIRMSWPNLPPQLHGLRILHLSDLHLGWFLTVRDLEAALARAAALQPDLILFTGDVADQLDQLAPALKFAEALAPRLGVFASIGNHEYYRGIRAVRRTYERVGTPLLLESGVTLEVDGARLRLSGADDPVNLRGDLSSFLAATVDRSLDGAPSDAFHLLMCHRPTGFVPAAAQGVHLTLAGHTHGAQLGLRGRSLLEPLMRDAYLWGAYQRGSSRLYTSAGFGHWFPFRLNCPTEAPIIVLERSA
jgi:hypothetical protein